jgi:hypothetical protein
MLAWELISGFVRFVWGSQPLALQLAPHPSSNHGEPPALEEWAAQHPFQRGPLSLFSRSRPAPRSTPPQLPSPPLNDSSQRVVGGPVTSMPIPNDGTRQPPTPNLTPTSSSRPQSLSVLPQPNSTSNQNQNPEQLLPQPQPQQVVDVPLLLGVTIAMPDPSRPHSRPHSPSSSSYPLHAHRTSLSSAKGKGKESDPSHDNDNDNDNDNDYDYENGNGELPELILGYAAVSLVVRCPPPGSIAAVSAPASVPSTQTVQAKQPSRVPSLRVFGSPSSIAVGAS